MHLLNPIRLLLILLFLNSCSSSSKSEAPMVSAENQVIHDLLERYYETMTRRDWPAYRTFFWDKATLTTAWQKPDEPNAAVHITSIDEFIAQTPLGPDSQPIFEERMEKAEIEVRNNLARAWVKFNAKFGSVDQLHEWEGTDLFTLMKFDGEWRIVALAYE